jgi:hypothetical protein
MTQTITLSESDDVVISGPDAACDVRVRVDVASGVWIVEMKTGDVWEPVASFLYAVP